MTAEVRPFRPGDEAAIRRVIAAALEVDALPGFNAYEFDREVSSMMAAPEMVAVAVEDGAVCGYVFPSDLTVHPAHRRRGHGRRLMAAGMAITHRAGLDQISLHVRATGAGPEFARAMGLVYRSSLWRLDLPAGALVPEPSFSGEVVARTFGEWLSLDRYVELLNRCFEGHPTPLSWTAAEIEYFHGRPEFDPSTTLLMRRADAPDRPVGFVRISVAPPDDGEVEPVGDVRLLGVLPEWRGRGLGRDLLRWAVAELRTRGAGRITLSVESENELALGLYRRTGFEPVIEWPHWVRSVASGAAADDGV